MTDGFEADRPKFQGLVEATAKNFVMQEVSADKAYLSAKNLQVVVDHYAQPYIPFKSNSVNFDRTQPNRTRPAIWRQMFHLYSFNSERFMQSYHK